MIVERGRKRLVDHAGSPGGLCLVLIALIGTLCAGAYGARADESQDEDRCRDLKKHGQLLAQQLEASKQCRKEEGGHSVTLTCSYRVGGTEIEVESSGSGRDWKSAENVGYTIKSLAPGIALEFGKGDRTGGYPMLKRLGPRGKGCPYDWAWLAPDEVIIASLVAGTL